MNPIELILMIQLRALTEITIIDNQIYRVVMRPLMLRTVGAVREGLGAVDELTNVRSLPGVRALMDLQILQARECLGAASEL